VNLIFLSRQPLDVNTSAPQLTRLRIAPPFVGTFWRKPYVDYTQAFVVDGYVMPRGKLTKGLGGRTDERNSLNEYKLFGFAVADHEGPNLVFTLKRESLERVESPMKGLQINQRPQKNIPTISVIVERARERNIKGFLKVLTWNQFPRFGNTYGFGVRLLF